MTTGEYILDENGNRVYDYGTYRKGSYNGYNFAQSMLYDKRSTNAMLLLSVDIYRSLRLKD